MKIRWHRIESPGGALHVACGANTG